MVPIFFLRSSSFVVMSVFYPIKVLFLWKLKKSVYFYLIQFCHTKCIFTFIKSLPRCLLTWICAAPWCLECPLFCRKKQRQRLCFSKTDCCHLSIPYITRSSKQYSHSKSFLCINGKVCLLLTVFIVFFSNATWNYLKNCFNRSKCHWCYCVAWDFLRSFVLKLDSTFCIPSAVWASPICMVTFR